MRIAITEINLNTIWGLNSEVSEWSLRTQQARWNFGNESNQAPPKFQ